MESIKGNDTMDMTPYADAMRDVATHLLRESGIWDVDEGAIADQMNKDERFKPLGEYEFVEVRDKIGDIIQTAPVILSWP